MDNKWFTFNNKGDVGVTDASKARAEQDLEYNRSKYPDEDWQMALEDEADA